MRLLLLIPALLLAALGWYVGPYLCLWLSDGVDAVWPHQHSSGTHRYLWGGVGGAMLARELEQVGGLAGALGFGFLALGALFPRHRVLLFLVPGSLGLVGNLVVVILWWNTSIRHGLLLVHGAPLVLSGILVAAGMVFYLKQRHPSRTDNL